MSKQYVINEFKVRKSMPTKNDGEMWTKSGYGGKSPAILGSKQAWKGSVLWNCVGYVFGRIWECIGIKPVYIAGKMRADLWISNGLYKTGTKPKQGAVCVWKNNKKNSGHIAFIEKPYLDKKGNYTCVHFTESGFNVYDWRYVKVYRTYCLITDSKGKTTKHWNYRLTANGHILKTGNKFRGYCYPIKVVEA